MGKWLEGFYRFYKSCKQQNLFASSGLFYYKVLLYILRSLISLPNPDGKFAFK